MGQKSRADALKSFLIFIFTVPLILSYTEISAALGYFLKIFHLWVKYFQK